MGSVIDLYVRKDDKKFNKMSVYSIPICQNQPANFCSNHFCNEHIKSHIHPSEFPHMEK